MAGHSVPRRSGVPAGARWRPLLRGRRTECEQLDEQLRRIAAGHSSVLVLRGEAGVGKTALLDYLAEQAAGFRVGGAFGGHAGLGLGSAAMRLPCGAV